MSVNCSADDFSGVLNTFRAYDSSCAAIVYSADDFGFCLWNYRAPDFSFFVVDYRPRDFKLLVGYRTDIRVFEILLKKLNNSPRKRMVRPRYPPSVGSLGFVDTSRIITTREITMGGEPREIQKDQPDTNQRAGGAVVDELRTFVSNHMDIHQMAYRHIMRRRDRVGKVGKIIAN